MPSYRRDAPAGSPCASGSYARPAALLLAAAMACAALLAVGLTACSGGGADDEGTTSGAAWHEPAQVALSSFDAATAISENGASIDVSHADDGYVAASATADSRLKLVVECNGQSYNYDLPQDGTPLVAPVNMGDGTYTVRVMRTHQR